MWPSEEIPDEDLLFLRVHKDNLDENGWPTVGAFRNRAPEGQPDKAGMSTDWEKYSTAQQTMERSKTPVDNIVVHLRVGEVRSIPLQSVEHTPIQIDPENPLGNRAHTDVWGAKNKQNPESRVKLRKACLIAETQGGFSAA